MMAANYQHIGGGVNRLGRHYSRFSGFWPMASVVDQSLALRKSQNRESNRRRRVKHAGAANMSAHELEHAQPPTPEPPMPQPLPAISRIAVPGRRRRTLEIAREIERR